MKEVKKIILYLLCVVFAIIVIGLGMTQRTNLQIVGKKQNFEIVEEEPIKIQIEQEVQKYLKVNEEEILLQQQITIKTQDNVREKEERLQIQVPIIQGMKPNTAIVLMNGEKIEEENYQYHEKEATLEIEFFEKNNLSNRYQIIYTYQGNTLEEQEIMLHTDAYIQIKDKDEIKVSDDKNITIKEIGEKISAQIEMTEQAYKGYMYEKANHETEYFENYVIEVSSIQNNQEEINIEPENAYISEQEGETKGLSTKESTIFKATSVSKEDMIDLLGEEGTIILKNEQNEEIAKLSKDSKTNEIGDIVIDYESNDHKIIVTTSMPVKEGTLKIKNKKAIQPNIDDTNEEIQTFKKLEETIRINESVATNCMNLLEPFLQAKIEVNKTELETMTEKEEIEIHAILTTNQNSAKLYKEPIIQITMPEEVEQISLKEEPYLLYEENLVIKNTAIEGRTIILALEGEQTNYKDFSMEGSEITLKLNLNLNKKATSNHREIYMNCVNYDNANIEAKTEVEIISPRELITTNNIQELGIETIGETENEEATLARKQEEKQINIQSEIINNSETAIKEVSILGNMPTEGNLGATIASPIEVNGAEAEIYYTQNEKATNDLNNSENGWTQSTETLQTASKYLVNLETLDDKQEIQLGYDIKVPSNLDYNQSAEEGYSVSYTNTETGINTNISSTYITMTTGEGPKLSGTIKASVGGQEIQSEDIVKRGEVVEYKIQVQNAGTENAENVLVTCDIPEGMTLLEINEPTDLSGDAQSGIADGYVYEHDLYHELESKTYHTTIENIEVGKTREVTMLLKVKQVTIEEEKAIIKAKINYQEEENETQEFSIRKQESNLELTLKSTNEYKMQYQYDDYVRYSLFVKNISNQVQNKVKIKLNLPEYMTLSALSIYQQGADESEEIDLSTSNNIEIEQIQPQQEIDLKFVFHIEKIEGKRVEAAISAYAEDSSSTMTRSNQFVREVYGIDMDLALTANKVNEYIKTDDIIEYKINVKNNSAIAIHSFTLEDTISEELTILSITQNGEEIEIPETNQFNKSFSINSGDNLEFVIKAVVNHSDNRTEDVECINIAKLLLNGETYQEASVSHTIEKVRDDNKNPDDSEEEQNRRYNIRGYAWTDANSDGKMDPNEEKVEGMKVNILNIETNEIIKQETTNSNGEYIFTSLARGEYMVVFEYDTARYSLAPYKRNGISESENSNAVTRTMDIGEGQKNYGVTDIVTILNGSISNINIGLVKEQELDLKLDKTIKKITVQDTKGTKIYSYQNVDLAKLELDAKMINNTNITIEYEMKITNVGKVEAYVREIVDNLPTGLSFNSNINQDWYQLKGNLYNKTLANEKLSAGESKTISLVVTKTMNTNAIGTYSNIASISKSFTESGISDINEADNTSKADVIISIKTGQAYLYITLTISNIMLIAIGIYLIKKKVLDKKI